ncbi:MAG: hypothetical protein JRI23_07040 [Deltaproteobacteria bacterium]|jgi:catechol 2,3-dioxygenase-like lactoylglutathione lyase family enzyme|nr:hypothetical protein [Deltaproteobacteria bacterium]MBW2531343.1 hypothetical protein [Deltaproteobacteria bacterium]
MSVPPSTGDAGEAAPALRFLSLFVPDLEAARKTYQSVLGVEPCEDGLVPEPHPFAAAGPVVFDLGGVKLALYQCDQRATHPGDVGIGLCVEGSPARISQRVAPRGGRVFFGPQRLGADGRELAVFVLPDRHFFEVIG